VVALELVTQLAAGQMKMALFEHERNACSKKARRISFTQHFPVLGKR
jgi:hypothetical protein